MSKKIISRQFYDVLQDWYESPHRKPLIVRGARQVGKSSAVRIWAEMQKLQLIEVNLERHGSKLKTVFESNDAKRIFAEIHLLLGKIPSEPAKCVLFLDEIQSCPSALPSLRYFYEDLPEIAVVCAGSLLEFLLSDHTFSMPVGRVEYRHMAPLSFKEFLGALGEQHLCSLIQKFVAELSFYHEKIEFSQAAHERLLSRLSEYFLIGGMPESVARYANGETLDAARKCLFSIGDTYKDDFPKYSKLTQTQRLVETFEALPKLVCRKFKYNEVSKEYRSREIKAALELLFSSGVLIPIYHSSANGVPLVASQNKDVFKLLCLDVGLLNSFLLGETRTPKFGKNTFSVFETSDPFEIAWLGQICEQFIGQTLVCLGSSSTKILPNYWLREGKQNNAEVDYLTQIGFQIVPIEVKSGAEGRLKSLHLFMADKKLVTAVRFYSGMPQFQKVTTNAVVQGQKIVQVSYDLLSLPLYLADWFYEILAQSSHHHRRPSA